MSFHSWLRAQKNRNDPVGDLSRDLRQDDEETRKGFDKYWRTVPKPLRLTPGTFRKYLEACGACDGAMGALDDAEKEWRRVKML